MHSKNGVQNNHVSYSIANCIHRTYVACVYNGEIVSLIGNQRVGIFPAKIRNSLQLIPTFDMMSKFPELNHSCRRRYVAKLFGGKKRIIIRMKKYRVQGYVFPVEYLRNGDWYSSSVSTIGKAKSHATSWYKLRLCIGYRFRDFIVIIIKNFECWPVRAL